MDIAKKSVGKAKTLIEIFAGNHAPDEMAH